MFRSLRSSLLLLPLLFLYVLVHAANTPVSQSAHWKQLVSDKAFGYKNTLESVKVKEVKPRKPYEPGKVEKGIKKVVHFFGDPITQRVIWICFIVLAIVIIFKLVLANDTVIFARKKKKLVASETVIEEVEAGNWEQLLAKAVAANDLKQAVRYSYMLLLQLLQEAQLIHYRDDKTNFDYYRELSHTAYKQEFKQLSRQYEYVIYGNYSISPEVYNQYISLFNQVKRQLGR